jgi:hypothetical protein
VVGCAVSCNASALFLTVGLLSALMRASAAMVAALVEVMVGVGACLGKNSTVLEMRSACMLMT